MKKISKLLAFALLLNPVALSGVGDYSPSVGERIVRFALSHGASPKIALELEAATRGRDVQPEIVVAVAAVESEFNPRAVSRHGCRGIMQVATRYWGSFSSSLAGIVKGIDVLEDYQARYGIIGGLHAFNVGGAAYERGRRNHKYVKAVLEIAREAA